MAEEKPHDPQEAPKSRPEPAGPGPAVYGGQWGRSGKQNDPEGLGKVDRPGRIETPNDEAPGAGEEGN